ncbi:hypothetical protein GCM10010156_49330 [Planobispora rosea]|uniref:PD-(D/E)XK endonuclease-like domain-containing protein n=1 Tax=Planobispora rosea TaxID=35762 RepID=A0A8J3S429_PLARO|nr:hypothetical protein [Planobispora rosea]GGS84842.1 hypothetical protein GCM10010156_49330 [Planobispora rosea]GIH86444.1 hypothetical protein Pro02_48520 [Planobispora rosea]
MSAPTASAAVREVIGDLEAALKHAITHQPRSLQQRLGPSEIGSECDRQLGYRLAGVPRVNPYLPWLAYIGTAMHAQLAGDLSGRVLPNGARVLVEQKVGVGRIGNDDIDGTSDIYIGAADGRTGIVFDWKLVGKTPLQYYRVHGPGPRYRVQVHTYGYGFRRRGLPVTDVGIGFLPRSQEFVHRHWWYEPYDEQIALNAIKRADAIATAITTAGPALLPLLRTAEAECAYCPWFRPGSRDLTRSCPGAGALLTSLSALI